MHTHGESCTFFSATFSAILHEVSPSLSPCATLAGVRSCAGRPGNPWIEPDAETREAIRSCKRNA